MYIKRHIRFSPEKRKQKGKLISTNVPLRMIVTYYGNRIDFTTGIRIDLDKWDYLHQRVKKGYKNKRSLTSYEINNYLLEYHSKIERVFKSFEIQDEIPTPRQIREAYHILLKRKKLTPTLLPEKKYSFWDIFNEFMAEKKQLNSWSFRTVQKFTTLKTHLYKWKKDLYTSDFNEKGLIDFTNSLYSENLQNSTVAKNIDLLKWIIRWAISKKHLTDKTLLEFKPKLKIPQKSIIFLTTSELKQLSEYNIPPSKKHLEIVRDIFLFSCYTGLRYSDISNLSHSHIKDTYLDIITQKTNDHLIIEFNNKSFQLYNKYKDYTFPNNRLFPIISNQKMNIYIKELAFLAGLKQKCSITYFKGNKRHEDICYKYELLTTHTGRRTFICNALALGIPPQVVMKWTGHSDYKTMKPYIDIADDIKSNAMSKFNFI